MTKPIQTEHSVSATPADGSKKVMDEQEASRLFDMCYALSFMSSAPQIKKRLTVEDLLAIPCDDY